jgi:hypothetical protein
MMPAVDLLTLAEYISHIYIIYNINLLVRVFVGVAASIMAATATQMSMLLYIYIYRSCRCSHRYVTPEGRVLLYTNVARGIKSVSSTTVIATLKERSRLESVLGVFEACVDESVRKEFTESMQGASEKAMAEAWRARLIKEALHGTLKRRLV